MDNRDKKDDKLQPVKIESILGMDNVSQDYELPVTERGRVVRNLVNVDLTNAGTPLRRAGYSKALDTNKLVSVWSDGVQSYAIDDGELYVLYANTVGALIKTPIINNAGASLGSGAAFCTTPVGVIVSDGLHLYYIKDGELHKYYGTPPDITTTSGGSDGQFLLATVSVFDNGVESAPSAVRRVNGNYPLEVFAATGGHKTYLYSSHMNGV